MSTPKGKKTPTLYVFYYDDDSRPPARPSVGEQLRRDAAGLLFICALLAAGIILSDLW
ncbi:hypothetical protein [Actinomadura sp. KC216]|uniref:hypothetical protein n=1 Tax=Actinomadura sp. KC216 TaxID=2530370 RepID=UPI0014048A4E|nr:hypothetical protein [Actinomadura sp. KC216]